MANTCERRSIWDQMLTGQTLSDTEFVAVDLETTGCRPGRNSIIEIGAVRFNATGRVDVFEELVRPDDLIPRAVEELTGIRQGMVADAPGIEEILPRFRDFAAGAILVAHNYRFDLSFLDFEAEQQWGSPFQRPVVDTLTLLRRLRPDLHRFSLGFLAAEYGLDTKPDHRAGNDARATAELLMAVIPDLVRLGLTTVDDAVALSGISGQAELAERLRLTAGVPDEPGVYLFRDSAGDVIFVGHARSLRTRTRQYFYPGSATDEIAREVASVTAVPTLSALDALLLEHRLVDRHRPRHNPAAHRSRVGYLIKADASRAFPGMRVVEAPRRQGRLIGPFTSKWAAETLLERLLEMYDLRRCPRRLDARLALRACSRRDANTCPAPCVRVPDAVAYGERFRQAVAVLEDDADFRMRLLTDQRAAAASGRYEDAIRDRDGLRALDRALSSYDQIAEASQRDVVMIEEADGHAVVSFIHGGLRSAVLRGERDSVAAKLDATLERVYFNGTPTVDPLRMSSEKIAEILIVAGFEESGAFLGIPVGEHAETLQRIKRALGLERRTPRRRHEVTSGV